MIRYGGAVCIALGLAVGSARADAGATASPIELVISAVAEPNAFGAASVELRLLNSGSAPETMVLPPQIEAELTVNGSTSNVSLERAPEMPVAMTVPAGGFAGARYTLHVPPGITAGEAVLAVPGWKVQRVAFAIRGPVQGNMSSPPPALADRGTGSAMPRRDAPVPQAHLAANDVAVGNAFLPNLSAYAPIYAVYGPGTNSDARLQISFKYQLFGPPATPDRRQSWEQGLQFAYTQRMFWDLGAKSSPFRNIDFMPELFYLAPTIGIGGGVSLSGQGGFRHESNGRSGTGSRSLNTFYVQPVASVALGNYRLSIGPRLWLYAGSLSDNPDIKRYRGNTGLFAEIGEDDGLRITTNTRFNFGSGKGAIDADISYPIDRLIGGNLNFYLFGQAFTGYGENLLDYNRRMTRLRVGLAIVR
ncbi:Phospholipase A [Sphingobium herbicidovorans NBRC 16415]|uniref:Phospholipase A1 n=1 Tax=Sphingobium herbicidovorans (strain ATCC 700291 / DSM 11019 / CCUG 56400 / KCTC 2939 / LMG 18315 / NBRC 16415 / MH) TaxID=1219045 RepID=A0A086P821_SPHHM|nr:Phospholipase A [Sphingobium herbicidovorans NBRC 16415]